MEDRVNGTGVTEADGRRPGQRPDRRVHPGQHEHRQGVGKLRRCCSPPAMRRAGDAGHAPLDAAVAPALDDESEPRHRRPARAARRARPRPPTAASQLGTSRRRRIARVVRRRRRLPTTPAPSPGRAPRLVRAGSPTASRRPRRAPARRQGPAWPALGVRRSRPAEHRVRPQAAAGAAAGVAGRASTRHRLLADQHPVGQGAATTSPATAVRQRQGHWRVPARQRDRAGHRDQVGGRAVAQRHPGTDSSGRSR